MKEQKWWKITLLVFSILICLSIPIILYFTIGQKDTNNKINLSQQNISYLADVQHMNKITEQEANTITDGIEISVQNKFNNLTKTKDYIINNLDTIKANATLVDIIITISSSKTSSKATGSFNLTFNVRENINDRSIEAIIIPRDEVDEISQDTVDAATLDIEIRVSNILNESQINTENIDWEIKNLNLMTLGAKFADFQDQINIVAIPSSTHLLGSFKISFQLS